MVDGGNDLLGGAPGVIGQRVALESIEDRPGAAGARGSLSGASGRHQSRDRLAAIGDDDYFSRVDGLDQLGQPVLGFKIVDLHRAAPNDGS